MKTISKIQGKINRILEGILGNKALLDVNIITDNSIKIIKLNEKIPTIIFDNIRLNEKRFIEDINFRVIKNNSRNFIKKIGYVKM
jgi:hypothetical protein